MGNSPIQKGNKPSYQVTPFINKLNNSQLIDFSVSIEAQQINYYQSPYLNNSVSPNLGINKSSSFNDNNENMNDEIFTPKTPKMNLDIQSNAEQPNIPEDAGTNVSSKIVEKNNILPNIVNIVSTVNLCCKINLKDFAIKEHNSQ